MKKHWSLLLLMIIFGCGSKPSETATSDDTSNSDTVSTAYVSTTSTAESNQSVPADDNICACSVSAYLDDPDPNGTNIRETPKGKITGQLHYDADCDCLTVSFTGSKDGWMRLSEGGWVHGKLFSVSTRNYAPGEKVYLQADPTEESVVVAEFDIERSFKVVGCCGSWLQVEDDSGKIGWLTGEMICANPLTNCS